MRSRNRIWLLGALSGLALAAAIPAIGQNDPKSLLPPGFGGAVAVPDKGSSDDKGKPADLLADTVLKIPATSSTQPAAASSADPAALGDESLLDGEELPVDVMTLKDLPAGVRRSTARVGILGPDDGDMGPGAFGAADGKYLSRLLRKTRAPIASRWAAILLRRALLSKVNTPRGVNGADWVAERAWILLRMGEADAAQALVQGVDVDQYTPKMFQVAMQVSLATADPAGLCAMVEPAIVVSKEPSWSFAKAMCAALSGESAQASALVDLARGKGPGKGIDGLLAEKVVGAGGNTRRAVAIQWDNVPVLTAWRFGLANATAVEIPDRLFSGASPRVFAWRARAPLVPVDRRVRDADVAAALGVFSSTALVDFYGQVADATDASAISGTPADYLRKAYAASEPSARIDAMRSLWADEALDSLGTYARLIVTARAAARLAPNTIYDDDLEFLLGSMLSAGLDVQAAKWAKTINGMRGNGAERAWGLLAVGAPGRAVDWSRGRIESYQRNVGGENGLRGKFLFAGMAGLARLSQSDTLDMAQELAIPIGRQNAWTRALDRAVGAHEPATVAVLCALGLGVSDWRLISPAQLYQVVSALNKVGLVAEARMVAAEAITRS